MRKLFSIIAAILFAGSMMAADATIAKGTTNSYDDVTINSKKAIKMGKSTAGGNMYITVGANATSLTFHAVAWKGEGNQKITIAAPTGVTVSKTEITASANDNLTGTGKAFEVTPESDYEFTVTLTGVESEGAQLTLTSAKRAIVWAATYEAGAAPTVSKPTFEPKDEEFEGLVTITLACETEGASIFFTLDGSEPATEAGGATQAYSAPFTITKTATVKAIAVKGTDKSAVAEKTYTKLVFTQYEVAEAIATALTKNDPIKIRGVVTKIELTPKNFVKYGSVNVWVKDATGAEGEFEFFQCYSLEADTFKAATPEFDPTSATVFSATSVTDKAGNTLAVGDTVIGKGRYDIYTSSTTTTYELQKNCYLTSIIPGPAPQPEIIAMTYTTDDLSWTDATASQGWWQIQGGDTDLYFSLSNSNTVDEPAGTYGVAVLDEEWSFVELPTGAKLTFTAGEIVVAVSAEDVVTVKGDLTATDGNIYRFDLTYDPSQENPYKYDEDADFSATFDSYTISDEDFETDGVIYVIGNDGANYIVIEFVLPESVTTPSAVAGTYPINTSADEGTVISGSYADEVYPSFAGVISGTSLSKVWYLVSGNVTVADNFDITVAAKNSKDRNIAVTLKASSTNIKNVETMKKVVKAIENGQLIINVNGVRYNVNGAIVK